MRIFLQFFSLSDRYERKARLLPGLLLAAAPALTAGAIVQQFATWYTAASSAVGVEFLVAIVLGHFARARGRRLEERLWKEWDGPPTTRWLRPWDETCSDQQKSKWRGAIKRLTRLTLPAAIPEGGTKAEVDRVITDATRQLRYELRNRPEAAMLATHNEDYGFARNLCGVRWHWVGLSLLSLTASGAAFWFGLQPYAGLAVAGVFSLVTMLIARELPDYVKRCSDRYAESLFATAMLISNAEADGATRPAADTAANRS
jgi:hypothetical protein